MEQNEASQKLRPGDRSPSKSYSSKSGPADDINKLKKKNRTATDLLC